MISFFNVARKQLEAAEVDRQSAELKEQQILVRAFEDSRVFQIAFDCRERLRSRQKQS